MTQAVVQAPVQNPYRLRVRRQVTHAEGDALVWRDVDGSEQDLAPGQLGAFAFANSHQRYVVEVLDAPAPALPATWLGRLKSKFGAKLGR